MCVSRCLILLCIYTYVFALIKTLRFVNVLSSFIHSRFRALCVHWSASSLRGWNSLNFGIAAFSRVICTMYLNCSVVVVDPGWIISHWIAGWGSQAERRSISHGHCRKCCRYECCTLPRSVRHHLHHQSYRRTQGPIQWHHSRTAEADGIRIN